MQLQNIQLQHTQPILHCVCEEILFQAANIKFFFHYTKDKRRVDVLLNATTRRDLSGGVVGMIGVGQDITERNIAEREKTRVAKELQSFIDTANAPIFGRSRHLVL